MKSFCFFASVPQRLPRLAIAAGVALLPSLNDPRANEAQKSAEAAPSTPCIETPVSVTGASPAEANHVCAAAKSAMKLFRQCGLEMPKHMRVRVDPKPLEVGGSHVFASFDSRDKVIRIVDLDTFARMTITELPSPVLPLHEFYRSVIVHEMSHQILRANLKGKKVPRAAHEYVAYSIQLGSMPVEARQRYLSLFKRGPPAGLAPFVEGMLYLAPQHFGALAYDHFSAPGNRCRILRGIVQGRVQFPSQSATD